MVGRAKDPAVQIHWFLRLRPVGLKAPLRGSLRVSPVGSLPANSSSSSSVITAVSTPIKLGTSEAKLSKVELFKEQSNFLRFPLNEELQTETLNINEAATQLIKFHGSYQQTNRDEHGVKSYQVMLRTKNLCGKVPNQLYLAMDDLADEFGIGTLRLTTRQTFQLHDIVKKNLKTVMSTIIRSMGSTIGACGDLTEMFLLLQLHIQKKIMYMLKRLQIILLHFSHLSLVLTMISGWMGKRSCLQNLQKW